LAVYNLASPNRILEPCDLKDLPSWFRTELTQLQDSAERKVLDTVGENLDVFVRWPERALLLWPECDRTPPPGKKHKYFKYPPHIKDMARAIRYTLDGRPNGPAIAAFCIAGGTRPERFGSSNAWSVHHLYSGKFPYFEHERTTHAAKECQHFTQSAGVVAVHPVADALVDEFPFFTWLLRARAYERFGYDPDGAFSDTQDEYGFEQGRACDVIRVPLERSAVAH
jgi:hypothetical protein